jgi:SAM-dependent methyltransferase
MPPRPGTITTPPPQLVEALCCPEHLESALEPGPGRLSCPQCGRVFGSREGIILMPPGSPAPLEEDADAVAAEERQRDAEAEAYDRILELRLLSRLEIPATLRPMRAGKTSRVVEVGCGTGRLTLPLLATGADVIAVDHSLESLRVLAKKERPEGSGRLLLVHGDATRLPIRSGWGTHVLSGQMLEHLPSEALRRAAVAEMSRVMDDLGRLALSAYWHPPGLKWTLQKEGKHSGEIFFYRFDREELHQLLSAEFEVQQLTGRLVYILLAHAVKKRES